ncbi:hypothetical protein LTR84_000741 [Exophiala bonariae]|uniref:Uncharacterized protein n=1 Tax=Exophiala bonariae TaxID=1690606 RepID=A0AAV9NU68_9EURO|nr:hypothetical protein LTR84_000741 [Exophiala bonariae]
MELYRPGCAVFPYLPCHNLEALQIETSGLWDCHFDLKALLPCLKHPKLENLVIDGYMNLYDSSWTRKFAEGGVDHLVPNLKRFHLENLSIDIGDLKEFLERFNNLKTFVYNGDDVLNADFPSYRDDDITDNDHEDHYQDRQPCFPLQPLQASVQNLWLGMDYEAEQMWDPAGLVHHSLLDFRSLKRLIICSSMLFGTCFETTGDKERSGAGPKSLETFLPASIEELLLFELDDDSFRARVPVHGYIKGSVGGSQNLPRLRKISIIGGERTSTYEHRKLHSGKLVECPHIGEGRDGWPRHYLCRQFSPVENRFVGYTQTTHKSDQCTSGTDTTNEQNVWTVCFSEFIPRDTPATFGLDGLNKFRKAANGSRVSS